jgi:hypothetical protein
MESGVVREPITKWESAPRGDVQRRDELAAWRHRSAAADADHSGASTLGRR